MAFSVIGNATAVVKNGNILPSGVHAPLEAEFRMYRQLSGGNYFVSVDQVISHYLSLMLIFYTAPFVLHFQSIMQLGYATYTTQFMNLPGTTKITDFFSCPLNLLLRPTITP